MAWIALAVAAFGQLYAAKQQNDAAQLNAEQAEIDSAAALQKAAAEESQARRQAARVRASQRAAYGASGIIPDQDIALQVNLDQAAEDELTALTIRYGGASSSQRYRNEAALQRFSGDQALKAGLINAGSTVVQGYISQGKNDPKPKTTKPVVYPSSR